MFYLMSVFTQAAITKLLRLGYCSKRTSCLIVLVAESSRFVYQHCRALEKALIFIDVCLSFCRISTRFSLYICQEVTSLVVGRASLLRVHFILIILWRPYFQRGHIGN